MCIYKMNLATFIINYKTEKNNLYYHKVGSYYRHECGLKIWDTKKKRGTLLKLTTSFILNRIRMLAQWTHAQQSLNF